MSELRFDDRVVIVTGAGRGLGAAYANLLASRGAHIVVNDLGTTMEGGGADSTPAEHTAQSIRGAGGSAVANTDDIVDPDGRARIIDTALSNFGRIDALINNAGIIRNTNFDELTEASLQHHLQTHLFAPLGLTKLAWPELSRRKGAVLFTGSAGMLGGNFTMAYNVAKAATWGLMRSIATQGAEDGVRVNAVLPGAQTRMQATAKVEATGDEALLGPDNAALMAAYLVHETCVAHGETFSTGRGRVARIFTGSTAGYAALDMTLESIAEEFPTVMATDKFFVERTLTEHRNRTLGITGS